VIGGSGDFSCFSQKQNCSGCKTNAGDRLTAPRELAVVIGLLPNSPASMRSFVGAVP
jgi:hypothetical protein